jgi:hypothetical protein
MSPHNAAPAGFEEAGAEFDVEQAPLTTRSKHSFAGTKNARFGLIMTGGSLLRCPLGINPSRS